MRHIALVIVLASCGENVDSIALGEYLVAARDADCRYLVRCGAMPDRATCDRANLGEYLLSPELVALVDLGHTRWNGEAAQACIEERANRSCDTTSLDNREVHCPPIFEGTLGEGEPCVFGNECISGECWNELCEDACCAGTCVGNAPAQPGNLYEGCRYSSCNEGYCDGNACQPFAREGESCGIEVCDEGLACVSSRCEPLPDTNEPCTDRCRQRGDRCSFATRTCGQGDGYLAECLADINCATGYACVDNRCDGRIEHQPGEACSSTLDCAHDSFCDRLQDRCVALLPDGAECGQGEGACRHACFEGHCSSEPLVCRDIDSCVSLDDCL